MIATLYGMPHTEEDFSAWSFAHAAHHRDICRVVFRDSQVRLDEYVLDPFDPDDMGNWPYLHQVMHQQMDTALGIAGYDLSEIDWQDHDRIRSWLQQHGSEHYRVGAILGLG